MSGSLIFIGAAVLCGGFLAVGLLYRSLNQSIRDHTETVDAFYREVARFDAMSVKLTDRMDEVGADLDGRDMFIAVIDCSEIIHTYIHHDLVRQIAEDTMMGTRRHKT